MRRSRISYRKWTSRLCTLRFRSDSWHRRGEESHPWPAKCLTQAERYSKGATSNPLNFRGYRVPFLYSTNGEVVWHHDIRHPLSRSRRISHFHTPAALAERLQQDFAQACERVRSMPNKHPMLRPYQFEANAGVEQPSLIVRDRCCWLWQLALERPSRW
jgi:type I site-specific restriction endonuclease